MVYGGGIKELSIMKIKDRREENSSMVKDESMKEN
jgi:hypothetical protein